MLVVDRFVNDNHSLMTGYRFHSPLLAWLAPSTTGPQSEWNPLPCADSCSVVITRTIEYLLWFDQVIHQLEVR